MSDQPDHKRDLVFVAPPVQEDGPLLGLRMRENDARVVELHRVEQGQPIVGGELVHLRPYADLPSVYEVDTLYESPKPSASSGPAQVATTSYRAGWDRIFGHLGNEVDGDEEYD